MLASQRAMPATSTRTSGGISKPVWTPRRSFAFTMRGESCRLAALGHARVSASLYVYARTLSAPTPRAAEFERPHAFRYVHAHSLGPRADRTSWSATIGHPRCCFGEVHALRPPLPHSLGPFRMPGPLSDALRLPYPMHHPPCTAQFMPRASLRAELCCMQRV